MPGNLKIRRFQDLEEEVRDKIAKNCKNAIETGLWDRYHWAFSLFEICFMASSDPLYSNLKRFFSNSRSPSSLILHSSFDIALLSTDK